MFQNIGTTNGGTFEMKGKGNGASIMTLDDAGIASGGAFLVSELEKRDPIIRRPLTSYTSLEY